MPEEQSRVVESLRRRPWRSAAIVALGAVIFVFAAAIRRNSLRHDALDAWAARSTVVARLTSTTVSAWLLGREGDTRLLATAASRIPQVFGIPAAPGVPTVPQANLTRSLGQSLASINQLHPFTAIWLFDRSGKVVATTAAGLPPKPVREAAIQVLAVDSGMSYGPFAEPSDTAGIAFAARVVVRPSKQRMSSAEPGDVIGAVVLTARAEPLLAEMATWSDHSPSETSSLIVGSQDSVYEFALTPTRSRGSLRGAWARSAAPRIAREAFATKPDTTATLVKTTVEFGTRVAGLPWALARHESASTVFAEVNSRLSTEASTAAAIAFMIAIIVIGRRQTARERKLIEVAESEVRYRLLADNATDVIARHAPDGRILYISPAVHTILGYHPHQIQSHYPSEYFRDEDPTTMDDILDLLRVTKGVSRAEHRLRHADGRYVWVETTGRAVRDPVWGQVTELVTVSRDIEDRKQAEEALRASEEDYRMLFDMNPQPMWAFDADSLRFVAVNDQAVAHYGYSREEFLGMTVLDIRPPESVDAVRERVANVRDGLKSLQGITHQRKDGTVMEVELTVHEVKLSGRMTRLVLVKDVTEARRTATALRESNELIRALFDSSPIAIMATDLDLHVLQWNGAAERLFGWTAEEVVGKPYPLATDEMLPDVRRIRNAALRDGTFMDVRAERLRKDATTVELSLSVGVIRDAALQPAGFVLLAADVSERMKLEAQLRHAQKMDAVGQLAGGIAHDFNNLLTVVTGYAGMLLYDLEPDSSMRPDIEEIAAAADRASLLTRQLLAFSRQQMLQPKVLDLNVVVAGMEHLLRRVLPASIKFITRLDPALSPVNADPGQIEQVLMNLIVNARDAMADGGTLMIETQDVRLSAEDSAEHDVAPGEYVMIAVSDTGCGIPRSIASRIFEPFFTTKARDEGTGLGLSTAHGIVTQSGGCISVVSEPGLGTTFRVCLPSAGVAPAASRIDSLSMNATAMRGSAPSDALLQDPVSSAPVSLPETEAILLVEDDAPVRLTTTRLLQRAGYTVLTATNGNEALEVHARERARIRLIITDMIMPEMSGPEFVRHVRERDPNVAVLMMSGYTDEKSRGPTILERGMDFIQKPFSADTLTGKVRAALDATASTA
jgi:PAS domain S-box-containing protein